MPIRGSCSRFSSGCRGRRRGTKALRNGLFLYCPRDVVGVRVADLGVVGRELSRACPVRAGAHVTVVDIYAPFLSTLAEYAIVEGGADRLETVCADMAELPLSSHAFDVVWSEGAITYWALSPDCSDGADCFVPGE